MEDWNIESIPKSDLKIKILRLRNYVLQVVNLQLKIILIKPVNPVVNRGNDWRMTKI